ncbi:MAG: SpoIID/LytB domain-containing protein [Acidimicrobiales bacterium]
MRKLVPAALAALLWSAMAALLLPPAHAAVTSLALSGHGYGHGRGMGQYGAYGYALSGQSSGWILDHYYGGTHAATVDPNQAITVRLSELDGYGGIGVKGPGLTVNGQAVPGNQTQVIHGSSDQMVASSGDVAVQLPGGQWRSYKGRIVIKGSATPGNQTWNQLGLDQYVGGVVPAESPSSWGVNGPAALQAQAVAARSYALAYVASNGVICDTTWCQVYDGDQDVAGTPTNSSYTGYSDQAVSATAGVVREWPSGAVALTEFSSSTGGYSAGGAFPAVVDDGDGVPGNGNPNHTWSADVPASVIQSAFPTIGAFQSAVVTSRNGLGDLGGRVNQIVISGTSGHVSLTGDQFAADFGLRSNWFAITNGGGPSGGTDGYWLVANDGGVFNFGAAGFYGSTGNMRLNKPIIGMAATPDGLGYWLVAADGGIFNFGDAPFLGSTGAMRLNKPVIGMAPTPDGRGYWLFASDGGIFNFGDAPFLGSTGAMRLNAPVVGMAALRGAWGYWLVASDGGIFNFGAAGFYGSTGNLRLNRPVVTMMASPDDVGYNLVAADGGIFNFGHARFEGALPALGISASVTSAAATADGGGYLEFGASGHLYPFGDAPFYGDLQLVPGWRGAGIGVATRAGA